MNTTQNPINRQVLVMMLGVPGSGKSTFARQLAQTLGFERHSTDAIRTELFGRPDTQMREGISESEKAAEKHQLFRLLDQRVEKGLLAGKSVIRDHMHHRWNWREIGRRQAAAVGALPVMVWVKTPHELAHKRGLTRQLRNDARVEKDAQKMWETIQFFDETLDRPTEDEICFEINGQADFKDQLADFVAFCHQHQDSPPNPKHWAKSPNGSPKQPVVAIMVGLPGSGKSTFARQIEADLGWQRINRVALRQKLFGPGAPAPKSQRDKELLEEVLDIWLRDAIKSGRPLICDYKHNRKWERDYTCGLARDAGARPVLVWVRTPEKTAVERVINRPVGDDAVESTRSHANQIVKNNIGLFEAPSAEEPVLELDGLAPAGEQVAKFKDFVAAKAKVSANKQV